MARRQAALILLALLAALPAMAAEPPALDGNRFVFQRPRVIARQYTVQFHAEGRGILLVDAMDERRLHRVPGTWSWRDGRLCLDFPPTFGDCVLLIRNRDFFLMARSEAVGRRNSAAANPAQYAESGSWGSDPNLLGSGVFVAGH